MSWCDKLGSTPSIGYKLDWHSIPSDILLHAVSPVVDRMVEGEEIHFSIDLKDALRLTFSSFDGFQYGFEPSKLFVSFFHRARIKTLSGGLPTLVPSSKIASYTDLLSAIEDRILSTIQLINKLKPRRLLGIGVVSTTLTEEGQLPPGLVRLVEYAGRPWEGKLQSLTFHAFRAKGRRRFYR
jgi:hypothetical protein